MHMDRHYLQMGFAPAFRPARYVAMVCFSWSLILAPFFIIASTVLVHAAASFFPRCLQNFSTLWQAPHLFRVSCSAFSTAAIRLPALAKDTMIVKILFF